MLEEKNFKEWNIEPFQTPAAFYIENQQYYWVVKKQLNYLIIIIIIRHHCKNAHILSLSSAAIHKFILNKARSYIEMRRTTKNMPIKKKGHS